MFHAFAMDLEELFEVGESRARWIRWIGGQCGDGSPFGASVSAARVMVLRREPCGCECILGGVVKVRLIPFEGEQIEPPFSAM
jgi:hypothetical protein